MNFELIKVHTEADKVGVVTLNRPKQLNALNDQLMDELGVALQAFDADPAIGCMILTGSEKAFAAGADIGAMASLTFAEAYKSDFISRNWEQIRSVRKPVIAAVSGFALGEFLRKPSRFSDLCNRNPATECSSVQQKAPAVPRKCHGEGQGTL